MKRLRLVIAWCMFAPLTLSGSAHALAWPTPRPSLEARLASDDSEERKSAILELQSGSPATARPHLVAALSDADDDVKVVAARVAGYLHLAEAVDLILPWFLSKNPGLRRAAAELAKRIPSPTVVAPLTRALGDPLESVREAAAGALAAQKGPDVVPALLGRVDDPAIPVRLRVITSLAELGDTRAVGPISGKTQDSAWEVRRAAAHALGQLRSSTALSALVALLRDQQPEVQVQAAAALGVLADPSSIVPLAALLGDWNADLRRECALALGSIGTTAAIEKLVVALRGPTEQSLSLDATPIRNALVRAGARAQPMLRALIQSGARGPEAVSAAWVLSELGTLGDPSAYVEALRKGTLSTPAAMRVLGKTTPEAIPVVLEHVSDPNYVVRSEALSALANLLDTRGKDGRAVEPLLVTLELPGVDTEERVRVARLLARSGSQRAKPALYRLLRSKSPAVQAAAVDALGELGGGLGPALVQRLALPDPAARLSAAFAIGRGGDEQDLRLLMEGLRGTPEWDAYAVMVALGGLLERLPSPATTEVLRSTYFLAARPQRSPILGALARSRDGTAFATLLSVLETGEPAEREVAASLLPLFGPRALPILRQKLAEPHAPFVLAELCWALGQVGDAADADRLAALARSEDRIVATNAAGALARLGRAGRLPKGVGRTLCPLVVDARERASVTANILHAVAAAGERCDGQVERSILERSRSESVRLAAVSVLQNMPSDADRAALHRCTALDRSLVVADRCAGKAVAPLPPSRFLQVFPTPAAPLPRAPYLVILGDNVIRGGRTDALGAFFEPLAPGGLVRMAPP